MLIRFLLCLLLTMPAVAAAAELKLATWNLEWLSTRPAGDPGLPRDVTPRRPADFALLRGYAERLAADVVALQEVDGPGAAALVFPPDRFALHFTEETDTQRPGFAVRQGIRFTRNPDLAALDLFPDGRGSLRRGADITLELGTSRLRLLSVHLKAGCRDGPLPGKTRECALLAQQVPALAGWIAARRAEGIPFAVLGDFNRHMSPPEPFLTDLRASAPLLRVTEGRSNPCWGGSPFIDHLLLGGGAEDWLVRNSLRVLVYAETGNDAREHLSDHCPVSARLDPP